jgi:hypothetical protein
VAPEKPLTPLLAEFLIDYVATDQNDLTSTSTRTVIIEAPNQLSHLPIAPSFIGGPIAVRTSHLSCRNVGKTRIFTPVRQSSGESPGISVDCHFSV